MALAVITGGATGIGAAAVRTFAAEGHADVALWISMRGRPCVRRGDASGAGCLFRDGRVQRASIVQSVEAAVAQLGAPDVLFANAGIQKLSSLLI